MFLLYSLLLSLSFAVLAPLFLLRKKKYAAGFRQRLGKHARFELDARPVVWLHCVSVGETNAARPIVEGFTDEFPNARLIVSTTTLTGQELAQRIFADTAETVFYFPFDFKFSVRRALQTFRPSVVLLTETEIWPRFIREASRTGTKIAVINGRLSDRSFRHYSYGRLLLKQILDKLDVALMQDSASAQRIVALGMDSERVVVTGNLKFDQQLSEAEAVLSEEFRKRFNLNETIPTVVAASTHDGEESAVLEALADKLRTNSIKLLIAPRRPERFSIVAELLAKKKIDFVRRSSSESTLDQTAVVILLDSIGELRAVFPLATIVFVGGSLVPHGGQSIIEPAAFAKAIVVGPHTSNFRTVVDSFQSTDAIEIIDSDLADDATIAKLCDRFTMLLDDANLRHEIGLNAQALVQLEGSESSKRTFEILHDKFDSILKRS